MAKSLYIKEVVRAPYICTVPGGGVRATKCYPDAHTYIINGKKVGYSAKEQALIYTPDCTSSDVKAATKIVSYIESLKKVANTAANNEAQIKR